MDRQSPEQYTRRTVLRHAGIGGLNVGLAGCTIPSGEDGGEDGEQEGGENGGENSGGEEGGEDAGGDGEGGEGE